MIDFQVAVFAWLCVFRNTLSRSGALSPERARMPLHAAVGVSGETGDATEDQGTGA